MSEATQELGGRIPLFDPKALTPAQNLLYDSVQKTMVSWAESSGFIAMLDDGRMLGPFNSILASPEIATSFLALQASEQEHTSLNERVRQVVILTVGAVWKSDYERYAHSAVACRAGLSDAVIRGLAQGEQVDGLTEEEKIAQRFTRHLTADHQIDDQLYAEAFVAFGVRGIVDLIVLAGCYDTVSSLLNAFKVPIPE